jgi:broad specificity phosphatase PhoE
MIKTLYLVRHGHYRIPHPKEGSGGNEPKVLTVRGIEDIISLSHKLRHIDKEIGIIYSSPLQRTQETATLLARVLRVNIETREQIQEDFFKEGNTEHLKEVFDRFNEVINEALDFQEGNAVIVSHKFPISLFVAHSDKYSYEEISEDKRHVNLLKMGACFKITFNKKQFIHYEYV